MNLLIYVIKKMNLRKGCICKEKQNYQQAHAVPIDIYTEKNKNRRIKVGHFKCKTG